MNGLKKISAFLLCALAFVGCAKRDPILPGVRHDIFAGGEIKVLNQQVPQLSAEQKNISGDIPCDYTQDISNTIWDGDKKVFAGFATSNAVKSNQSPVCSGRFIYSGLSTGEAIKIDSKSKRVIWTTDVYKERNLTGAAAVVDIIAHVGVDKNFVYVGGLGDAFCKLKSDNGDKVWCVDISVPVDFIIVDNFAFVVGSDNNLYAINTDSGNVYWKTEIKRQDVPKYNGEYIKVGRQKIDYKNGLIK